jgi:hypothetical protein
MAPLTGGLFSSMELQQVNHLEVLQQTGWEFYDGSDKWFIETCPYCGDTESNSKKKKCYVWKDTGNFKCFRCGQESGTLLISREFLGQDVNNNTQNVRARAKKLGTHKKKVIDDDLWHQWETDLFEDKVAVEYLTKRGLSNELIAKHHLGLQTMGVDEYVVFPYFYNGVCTSAKKRKINSKSKNDRFTSESGCTATLYNLDNIKPGKPLIITESEIDCLSLLEVGFSNVVALPGCGSWKEEYADDISLTTLWYLCFDPDKPGQDSAKNLITRYGNKVRNIVIDPLRDINELLVDGDLAMDVVLEKINEQKSESLRSTNAFMHDGKDIMSVFNDIGKINVQHDTGFKCLDKIIGGWRPHELTVLSADSGMGKSTVAFLMALEQAKMGNASAVISLEEPTQSMIIKQLTHFFGKPYHECTADDIERFRPIAVEASKLPIYHHHNPGFVDIDELISDLIFEIERHGVKFVVIDHLDFIEAKMGDSFDGDLKYTRHVMKKISNMVKNHPVHVMLIAHTRKKRRLASGEEISRYTMDDIRGNSDIIKLANNVMFFYRLNELGNVQLDVVKVRSPAARHGMCDMHFSLSRMKLSDPNDFK